MGCVVAGARVGKIDPLDLTFLDFIMPFILFDDLDDFLLLKSSDVGLSETVG